MFVEAFNEYTNGKTGPIYWRFRPELIMYRRKYAVRARLFIEH